MKKLVLFTLLLSGLFMNKLSAQIVFQSDFETWTGVEAVTGWDGSKTNIIATGDSARKDSVAPYHGSYCVSLVNASTTAKRFSTQPMSITAGTIYNIRFYVKGTGSIRTGLNGVRQSTGFGYEYGSYIAVSSPTWTAYTQTLLADSTNSAAQFLFSIKSTVAPANLALDSVTITAEGTASPQTLYNIQYTTATPANSPFMNKYVTTGGIVTAVYNSGTPPTQSGYYIESKGATAWSAVNVYDYSHPVAMGDSISFSGQVQEYYNETEIANVVNFTKVSSGNALPAPVIVGFDKIQNEKYEGMLVKIKDATEVRYNAPAAWYVFADSTAGIDTVDNVIYTYNYTQSKKYTITGVVHFEYANWIEPRNINDIDSINVTSGIAEYKKDLADMNIYPNPNNGLFTVSVTAQGEEPNMTMTLCDLTGRVVYSEQRSSHPGTSSWPVNTNGLEKGIYLLELSNSQYKTVKKVIVQ
jgi:hypothetical protein